MDISRNSTVLPRINFLRNQMTTVDSQGSRTLPLRAKPLGGRSGHPAPCNNPFEGEPNKQVTPGQEWRNQPSTDKGIQVFRKHAEAGVGRSTTLQRSLPGWDFATQPFSRSTEGTPTPPQIRRHRHLAGILANPERRNRHAHLAAITLVQSSKNETT